MRGGVVVVLVAALCGCGGQAGPLNGPECTDEVLPTLPVPAGSQPPGGGLVATLEAEQGLDARTGDAGGYFNLYFQDMSTYDGKPAPVVADSPTCWRVTGQPVITAQPTDLTVGSVRVEGVPGGAVDVGQVTGVYRSAPLSKALGTAPLRLVSSADTGGSPTFPDLDISGPAAAPIGGLAVYRSAIGAPLQVQWTKAKGTYIQIEMFTQDPAHPNDALYRNRVVCRIVDDGCHRIPAGAIDWLTIYDTQATLQIERHRVTRSSPANGALATVDTFQTLLNEVDLRDGRLIKGTNP